MHPLCATVGEIYTLMGRAHDVANETARLKAFTATHVRQGR